MSGRAGDANGPVGPSSSQRVRRGFTRLALVAGGICLVVGLYFSYDTSESAARHAVERYATISCLKASVMRGDAKMRSYDRSTFDVEASGCRGWFSITAVEAAEFAPYPSYWRIFFKTIVAAIGATFATVAVVFGAVWSVGWVLSGFFKD